MKSRKPAAVAYNENMDDYTARIFHSHAILAVAAIPFSFYIHYDGIREANFAPRSIINGVLWCSFFWVLLIMGIVARRFTKKFEKHPRFWRWALDLMTTSLAGFLIWSVALNVGKSVNPYARYVTGWWSSLMCLSIFSTISRWYLRTMAYTSVVAIVVIYAYIETGKLRVLFILFQVLIYFVLSNFLSDRNSKRKFMEKQKLYEETQVFKEILDQTTDGILIYGLKEGLMYRNWETNKYKWWKEGHTLDENLKMIKVDQKKSTGNLITQPIVIIELSLSCSYEKL